MGWRAGPVVAAGAVLPVVASVGPMAAELGAAMLGVWLVAALIGAAQCALLAELASRFPARTGGTATYAHGAFGHRSALPGAISGWGYWLAWTPGIAVNLVLAAGYLRAAVGIDAPLLAVAAPLAAALYAANALGLRLSLRVAGWLAPLAAVPLLGLAVGALLEPGALGPDRLAGGGAPEGAWAGLAWWLLIAKWLFVAAWAAYGAEMATTVVAEMRDPSGASRALALSAGLSLVGFVAIPAALLGLAGPAGLAADPLVALLPAAEAVYGPAARPVLGLMLAAALLAGAQVFVIGSSRTLVQMARDGLLPPRLARVNRHGAPAASTLLDGAVITVLLGIHGPDVVAVAATANVGYLVVFILMPLAFLVARRRDAGRPGGIRLARPWTPLAIALGAVNAGLLVVGGAQWGPRVLLVGAALLALAVPLALIARRRPAPGPRRSGRT